METTERITAVRDEAALEGWPSRPNQWGGIDFVTFISEQTPDKVVRLTDDDGDIVLYQFDGHGVIEAEARFGNGCSARMVATAVHETLRAMTAVAR